MNDAINSQQGARPVRRGDRQARFLAQSVILEESGSSGAIRMVILSVAVIVIAAAVWSALTHIDEVAVTAGEVVPAGQVQTVQHLEGGIIKEILVKEGEAVEAGSVLFRLDATQAATDLEQTRARRAGLQIQAERLRSIGASRTPDFSAFVDRYPDLVADQEAIYDGQVEARDGRRAVLVQQTEQRLAEIRRTEEEQETIARNAEILAEELDLRERLFRQGLTSKIAYLNVKRQVNEARGEISRLIQEGERLEEALVESENRLEELDADLREQSLAELSEVVTELAQVDESLARLEDRVSRLEIRSPVRGIVKGIRNQTVGGVIPAGGIALEVVPVDEELQVETRISTRDVGHVRIGQEVNVKVTSFDFARFGGIDGELRDVSASTFIDEQGEPYYKGVVVLNQNYVGIDPKRNKVIPGMTVQADILTGNKTLFEYMLKPVVTSVSNAFHER